MVNKELSDSFISFYPILTNNKIYGYVYIINDIKLDKLTQKSIEYGISIIAAKLERDENTTLIQTRINKTLVEIMLNYKELSQEFYKNVELNLNWNKEGFVYGFCFKLHPEEDNNIQNCKLIIYNYFDNIVGKNNYLFTEKNSNIFVFVKIDTSDYLKDFISSLIGYIKTYEDIFTISMGVSKPYKDIESIKQLYDEAYLAVLFSNHDIVYYNSLHTIKLLYPLKHDDRILEYYNRTIKKLEKYDKDNDSNLLETLETFLKCNFKKTLAANKLFIHIETLRYRLNRIEDITRYSVNETEGLFTLQMGLHIKNLLRVK